MPMKTDMPIAKNIIFSPFNLFSLHSSRRKLFRQHNPCEIDANRREAHSQDGFETVMKTLFHQLIDEMTDQEDEVDTCPISR